MLPRRLVVPLNATWPLPLQGVGRLDELVRGRTLLRRLLSVVLPLPLLLTVPRLIRFDGDATPPRLLYDRWLFGVSGPDSCSSTAMSSAAMAKVMDGSVSTEHALVWEKSRGGRLLIMILDWVDGRKM